MFYSLLKISPRLSLILKLSPNLLQDKVVGESKEAYGKLTNDKSTEVEGKVQSGVADLKQGANDVKNDVFNKADDVKDDAKHHMNETHRDLNHKGESLGEKIKDKAEDVKEFAEDKIDDIKNKFRK